MHTKTTFSLIKICSTILLTSATLLPQLGFAGQAATSFTTATRYNLAGQITGVIRPSPEPGQGYPFVRNTYNSRGLLERVEEGILYSWYDETVVPSAWGNSAVSRLYVYTYDNLGRKATEATLTAAGSTEKLTQFSYNDLNQLVCKAERMNPAAYSSLPTDACALGVEGSFGPDRITKYEYLDPFGQVTKEWRALGTNLQQAYSTRQYDASGRLTDQKDANGNLTRMTYDSANRLEYMYFPSKVTGSGTYNTADFEKYSYDNNGNRTSLRKRDGQIIYYAYDALNRPWFKDIPASAANDIYLSFDLFGLQKYARFGNINGFGINTSFNGFGELTSETSNVNGVSYTLSYNYDKNGNRKRITHPDNAYFSYRYDGLDRLSDIYEGVEGGTALIHKTWDALVRPETTTTSASVTQTTGYDGLSRPSNISLNPVGTVYDVNHGLGYNPAGQIVLQSLSNNNYQYRERGSKIGTYQVNGLNEYTSVGGKTFSYDANANLTSDGDTTYTYDVENRLTRASGVRTATLNYDPQGRLYQTTAAGATTYFLYSGDALVAEYQNGSLTKRHVFGGGIDNPLISYSGAVISQANRQFLHANYQGSIIAASDSGGNVSYVNTYDAYGVPGTGNQGRFAYTGQTYLPELGMYYYKARFYHPGIGRFMQTDPIGYKDDLNLYAYAHNSPYNYTDPTGHSAFDIGFLFADTIKLGVALYTGVGVASAAVDFGASVLGVASPIPGTGQFLKGLRGAENAVGAARALEKGGETALGRAKELHSLLDPRAQRARTTAVTPTVEGISVVSSSEKRLSRTQREALGKNEVEGVGVGHAEATGVKAAQEMGLTPTGTAASRPICSSCQEILEKNGIDPLSKTKK